MGTAEQDTKETGAGDSRHGIRTAPAARCMPTKCWRPQGWEGPLGRAGLWLTVSLCPQGRGSLGEGGQGHAGHPGGHWQPLTAPRPRTVEGSVSVSGVLSSSIFGATVCLLCRRLPCSRRASAARDAPRPQRWAPTPVPTCSAAPVPSPTCPHWAGVLQEGREGPAHMLLLGPCGTAPWSLLPAAPHRPVHCWDPWAQGSSACPDTYQALRTPPCTHSRCRTPGGTCWPSCSGWSPGRAAWGCPARHTGR